MRAVILYGLHFTYIIFIVLYTNPVVAAPITIRRPALMQPDVKLEPMMFIGPADSDAKNDIILNEKPM